MKMFLTSVLASLALLSADAVLSTASAAQPYLVWCQNCGVKQTLAAATEQPVGTIVYVADAIGDSVAAYRVESRGDGSRTAETPHGYAKFAVAVDKDPAIVEGIHKWIDWYGKPPVGFHKHVQVAWADTGAADHGDWVAEPGDWSVYDLATAGADRNNFVDAMARGEPNLVALHRMRGLVREVRIVHPLAMPAVHETVTLPQQGRVDVVYRLEMTRPRLDPDSAWDAQGNPVPYIGSDGHMHNLGGVRLFSTGSDELQRFLAALERFGVPVVPRGKKATSGPGGLTCVADTKAGKRRFVCRAW